MGLEMIVFSKVLIESMTDTSIGSWTISDSFVQETIWGEKQ